MRVPGRSETADRIRGADNICVDFAGPITNSGDPSRRCAPPLGHGPGVSAIESKKLTVSLMSTCGLSCPI